MLQFEPGYISKVLVIQRPEPRVPAQGGGGNREVKLATTAPREIAVQFSRSCRLFGSENECRFPREQRLLCQQFFG